MRLAQCLDPTKIEKYSLKGATNAKHRTIICNYSSIFCNERKKEKKKKALQTMYIFINRDE